MYYLKNMGICASCERYFWKNQLSLLPNDPLRFNRKYCPECYPDILEKHTKLYYEHKL
jgi:hypothetical protein